MNNFNFDIQEIKSFLAKRGEIELLKMIEDIEEQYQQSIDPDYNPESDNEDYQDETQSSSSEEEIELDKNGLVPEIIKVKQIGAHQYLK